MKILHLFRSFSPENWHWLRKYLHSPAHNRHKEVILLFDYFFKNSEKLDHNLFDSATLSAVLFGSGPVQADKTYRVVNYLLREAEDFLSWQAWKKDGVESNFWLLSALQQQRVRVAHQQDALERLKKKLIQEPLRNPEYLRKQYRMEYEHYQMELHYGKPNRQDLQNLSDWHDRSFIAEKLKNACILATRQRFDQQTFNTGLLVAILQFVEQQPDLLEIPAIAVYYFGYKAITEPENETAFRSLRQEMERVQSIFTAGELRDIYLLAINYCIYRVNRREEAYLQEVYDLYVEGLAAQIFIENGVLSKVTYTNIVNIALRQRAYDWTLGFINQYRDALSAEHRHPTYCFNLARYYSDTSNYPKAVSLLREMDFGDPLINLQGKMMLIKMYYETDEYAALDSMIASTDTYLRRKKQVSMQTQVAHRNTLRFIRRLLALKPGDKTAKKLLLKEMENTPEVAMKEWLIQCLKK